MSKYIYTKEIITFINKNIKVRPDVFKRKFNNEYQTILNHTTNLQPSTPLRQRFYHLLNDIYNVPKCLECDNYVMWDSKKNIYRQYCGRLCAANSKKIRKKTTQTCLKKYGGIAPACSDVVQNKMKNTSLKNHGVEHFTNRVKAKETCLLKYNIENPSQLQEVKEQKKVTCLKNHGVEYAIQSLDIRNQIKQTMIERHGVENISHLVESQERKKQTNLKKYGVESHTQLHVSKESLELLNDPKWLIEQHHNKKITLTNMGQVLGVAHSTVSRYFKKYNIEIKFFEFSMGEKEVLTYVMSILPPESIIKANIRTIIPPYELDIYLPEYNIAIEYNGDYWHRNTQEKDNLKKQLCEEQGITLLTVCENEWLNKNEQAKTGLYNSFN